MSFIYENTYYLTDKGIGWVDSDVTAHLVTAAPLATDTTIPEAVASVAVPERTWDAGVASCGAMTFLDVPPGTNATGIVYSRDGLPLAYQDVLGAETAGHVEDLLLPGGEVFRL
jgi:hypothetical protein